MQPGWVSSLRRGLVVSNNTRLKGRLPTRNWPISCAHRYHPAFGGSRLRRLIKDSFTFTRPVFPLPVDLPLAGAPLGLNPQLHTPSLPMTHVGAGTGLG